MSASEQTKTLSVHVTRDKARSRERAIQALLERRTPGTADIIVQTRDLAAFKVPTWAKGVRVETTALGLLHVVVATSNRGH